MSSIDFLNPTGEERLLFAKICDLAQKAERGRMAFSRFLNLREREIARAALSSYNVNYIFYGGFEGAEKTMLGVSSKDTDIEESYFPMSLMTLTFPKDAKISHRDVLGAIMGLGIERNSAGDIFLYENKASFPVLSVLEDTVERELVSVGRYPCRVSPYEGDGKIVINKEEKTVVLASMRLDCVVSALTNKSRGDSSEIIKRQYVLVNDKKSDKLDEIVPLGAVIVIRGFGKFKLADETAKTSKDKIRIIISKYI